MMPKRPLDVLLGSPALVKVLRVLTTSSRQDLTGREIARMANVAASQATLALRRLEGEGVVWRRVVGRADLWSLSRERALTAVVDRLFGEEMALREGMLDDLRQTLRRLPVERALIFGSVARGEDTDRSDLDVFVDVSDAPGKKTTYEALLEARVRFAERYGVDVSPLILTSQERRRPTNPHLLANVERDALPLIEA